MATRTFRASPDSVPSARRFVAKFLTHLPRDFTNTVALLASELATNAVLYGDGDYEVSVSYSRKTRRARVEVTDSGPGRPRPQRPDVTAEHGRGLRLVDALCDRWGLDSPASTTTKTVWFELVAPAPAAAGATIAAVDALTR